MSFPTSRPRRLRATDALRRQVRETRLSPDNFIAPLFVVPGEGVRREIGAMPGCHQTSVDELLVDCRELDRVGVPAVILFGLPASKDPEGSGAHAEDGPVPTALRALRRELPDMVLWADVCLCEYTDHGHCGPLHKGPGGQPEVDNDRTLPLLAKAALAYAEAGAHVVAPSDMMDGRVPRSTGRSARPRSPPPRSATVAATRWIPRTPARRCGRSPSTSTRGPTS